MSQLNIRPEYYTELDRELRKEYQRELGINPLDVSLVKVTKEEQIERIAKNYWFWEKRTPNLSNLDNLNGKDMAKSFICQNACAEMLKKAEDCGLFTEVMERIAELREGYDKEQESCKACKTNNMKLYLCSRCRSVKYCSKECQKKDWTTHKHNCGK